MWRRAWNRLAFLFRRGRFDRELTEELDFHRTMIEADKARAGFAPDAARRAARRQLGNMAVAREDSARPWAIGAPGRDARSPVWLEPIPGHVRHAFRALAKSPGFAAVAIGTLAVGMAAVTALFSVLDGVVLKALPYPDANRIVSVFSRFATRQVPRVTGGDEQDVSAAPGIFDATAYYDGGNIGVQVRDHAEFVSTEMVSVDFFRVFGVAPIAGRLFTSGDAERSAIVSEGFAARNFGSAAAALHQSLFGESDSHAYEIVGVMPAVMNYPAGTDVWGAAPLDPSNRNRTAYNYHLVGRLAAGVSTHVADARLQALAARLASVYPDSNRGKDFFTIPLQDTIVGQVGTTLYVLMAAAGLLLLIACANVANLMLARGASRVRETAVRSALGASRRHIVLQSFAESFVISALACGLAFCAAEIGIRGLSRVGAQYVPLPRLNEIRMDWRVFAAGIILSLLTTTLCGLIPAIRASRVSLQNALQSGRTRGTVGARAGRLRSTLVVIQIALSCLLAVNAGLLLRTFVSLTDAPLGFERANVLVMYADAPARASNTDKSGLDEYLRIGGFFDDVLARVRRMPDVVAAGAAMGLPTGEYSSDGSYAVEGKQTFSGDVRRLPSAGFRLASPAYFQTLGIPIERGRDFSDDDVYERPAVAIISAALARQTFGDQNPLGHRVMCGLDRPDIWMTIVGVVGDVRQSSPAAQPGPELYMPLRQHPYMANEVQVVIRSRVPAESLAAPVRAIVRAVSPDVAMRFTTLDDSVTHSIATPRFRAALVSTCAIFAIVLALAGIYALLSYLTAQRTAEFGLRTALGARFGDVVRLVLAGACRLALVGVSAGLFLAFATRQVLRTMLFGVTDVDIVTYVGVLLLAVPLIVVVAAIPAFRAARVDPSVALKSAE